MTEAVARLCEVLPVKQVAEFYGLGWETVKEIHKSWLQRTLEPVDLSGVRVIGSVVKHDLGKKLVVATYKRRTGYRRKKGHRQQLTRVAIDRIVAS